MEMRRYSQLAAATLALAVVIATWGAVAPAAAQGPVGTWTLTRSAAAGTQTLTLDLRANGEARLTVESARGMPYVSTGRWDQDRSGRIHVDVSGGGARDQFTFRQDRDRLVSTAWDRDVWGRNILTFRRVSGSEVALEGTYSASRRLQGQDQRLVLTLEPRGRATLVQEYRGVQRASYVGTWDLQANGRLMVEVTGPTGRETFTFRPESDGRRLAATAWDREQWGRNALNFTRQTGAPPVVSQEMWQGRHGDRTLSLRLMPNGVATLVVSQPRRPTLVYRGNWQAESGDRIGVRVARGAEVERFTFRRTDGRLVAVDWNRNMWGSRAITLAPSRYAVREYGIFDRGYRYR